MKTFLIATIIASSVLAAGCSPKEQTAASCEADKDRIGKLMEYGTPLTEADKDCVTALTNKAMSDTIKKMESGRAK